MAKGFETATIAELRRPDGWSPIRRELGVQAFGVNAYSAAEAGARVIPAHDEVPSGHEELYVVVAGRATFTVGGEEVDAPAGTLVFVPDPATTRAAVAAEPGTTVLAVGGRPGAAYRPRSFETSADVFPLFDAGRFEEARGILLGVLDLYEDRGTVLYNLACAEAQLGEPDAALEHLAEALRDQPELAAHLADDADLEPIRADPRFPAG